MDIDNRLADLREEFFKDNRRQWMEYLGRLIVDGEMGIEEAIAKVIDTLTRELLRVDTWSGGIYANHKIVDAWRMDEVRNMLIDLRSDSRVRIAVRAVEMWKEAQAAGKK